MATRKLNNRSFAALLTRKAAGNVRIPEGLDPELKDVAEAVRDGFARVGLDPEEEPAADPDVIEVEGTEIHE